MQTAIRAVEQVEVRVLLNPLLHEIDAAISRRVLFLKRFLLPVKIGEVVRKRMPSARRAVEFAAENEQGIPELFGIESPRVSSPEEMVPGIDGKVRGMVVVGQPSNRATRGVLAPCCEHQSRSVSVRDLVQSDSARCG